MRATARPRGPFDRVGCRAALNQIDTYHIDMDLDLIFQALVGKVPHATVIGAIAYLLRNPPQVITILLLTPKKLTAAAQMAARIEMLRILNAGGNRRGRQKGRTDD